MTLDKDRPNGKRRVLGVFTLNPREKREGPPPRFPWLVPLAIGIAVVVIVFVIVDVIVNDISFF